ncbi:Crossover junction endonuclease EME1 [Varanus komodoensis]|nr:Crossover junction endonuclease EME1 [Varanus komodoensis]
MFPESDGEELPCFHFLTKQLPGQENPAQPPLEDSVVMLSSSDAEDSSASSPVWKKSCLAKDFSRPAPAVQVIALQSSESEEDEPLIPLAERLKRKFLVASCSTVGTSFTKIQEQSNQDSGSSNDKQEVAGCGQQSLPRGLGTQARAAPRSWEVSDSDSEMAALDHRKQPLLQPLKHVSECLVQNNSHHQGTEINLKHLPLQANTKRSQEELDKARQAALQRKKEREARKVLQERERERKKALANLRKAQRPDQCLKHIQVVLDPGLLQVEGGGQLLAILQSMECSCVIANQAVPRSITWRRKAGLAQADEDSLTEEPNILVVMMLEEFVAMIRNYKQISMEGPTETLQSFVTTVMKRVPGKTIALATVELEKYFSSHKQKSQKKLPQATQSACKVQEPGKQRGKAGSVPEISRADVEEALVSLQLHTGVQVRVLESWKELGDFICMFTKAVAEAPFKRERDKTGFSFCLEGDWSAGTKVERSGKGLLQVWKRQIQQFNRVSLDMANAIVAQYPSPLLLMEAYNTHSSEQERHNLLAEIPVRRGDGVTATTRRVGPDLSKRVYLQMTSCNPDLSLDVTG